ncbi:MAG: hemerythrin domain-containing protein [Nocardioides sp.]
MSQAPSDFALLAAIRQRRAELRESMNALEFALAAAAPADGASHWVERVHAALLELSGDFRQHVAVTEGPDGLYEELERTAPRLAGSVNRLAQEHVRIHEHVDGLLALVETPAASEDVENVRSIGTGLLGRIVRHRQHGADLVYEAYEVDVGGDG